jgi:hypothetical protein
MKKSKPNYTKFMRKPPALRTACPSESDFGGPLPGPIREQDIPWAEIVEEVRQSETDQHKPVQPPIVIDQEGGISSRGFRARLQAIAARAASIATRPGPTADPYPATDSPPLPVLLLAFVVLFLVIAGF